MKFGICSEIFNDWGDIDRTIEYVKEVGYDGLEIAPYTLAQYVTDIPWETREAIARKAQETGLEILGLHWIMIGPEGMHLTHPDKDTRDRTAQYLCDLARFCRDVGGGLMVFGSPKQRNVEPGLTHEQAMDNAVDVLEKALPICAESDVTICMEPLAPTETNFCASAAETVALIERVNHPKLRLLLDTKAMTAEEEDRPTLVRKYAEYLAHYHANDANLEGPGFGDVDFGPIFEALKDIGYQDYVSVEVFKFDPGPENIATKSLEYMKQFV